MSESNFFASPWVIITGAAGGIGQALVRAFTSDGYRVLATDLLPKPVDLPCTHYLEIDLMKTVRDELYAREIFEKIELLIGGQGLHVLVNNAAVQKLGGVDDLSREDWRVTMDVNLIAPFIWTQALLTQLELAQGSVVNISSIHAKLTKKNFVAYATSKSALSGLTRAMAVDLGSRVRINAIEPGAIQTDMLIAGFNGRQEEFNQLAKCHPRSRIGRPEEVANVALTLTKQGMDFLSGCSIGLDGGIASRLHDPE